MPRARLFIRGLFFTSFSLGVQRQTSLLNRELLPKLVKESARFQLGSTLDRASSFERSVLVARTPGRYDAVLKQTTISAASYMTNEWKQMVRYKCRFFAHAKNFPAFPLAKKSRRGWRRRNFSSSGTICLRMLLYVVLFCFFRL